MRRAAAAALVLAAAGCGGGSDDARPTSTAAGGEPGTRVLVLVHPRGADGPVRRWTLECDPPGGSHPAPERACEALERTPRSLEPVPDDVACTEMYGGPEQASVTGHVAGRPVEATFSRANGCEIARWDALRALLSP